MRSLLRKLRGKYPTRKTPNKQKNITEIYVYYNRKWPSEASSPPPTPRRAVKGDHPNYSRLNGKARRAIIMLIYPTGEGLVYGGKKKESRLDEVGKLTLEYPLMPRRHTDNNKKQRRGPNLGKNNFLA